MRFHAMLALIALTSVARAQEPDHALGPWFDAHYTQASGTSVSGEVPGTGSFSFSTGWSSGGGLSIGFGFAPWLSAFTTVDGAGKQPITTATGLTMSGALALDQIDAGIRAQVPIRTIRLTPYGVLAYSSRVLSGHVSGLSGGTSQGTFTTWGNAWTYGAGLEFFFARAFSVDASWQQTSGTYARLKLPTGAVFASGAGSSKESRVLAGVTWHAGPQTAEIRHAAPGDSLQIGEDVHVFAGAREVRGRIASLGKDTLIVQQIVHDEPAQTAVPIACISRVDRLREERPMAPLLINGATLGAIGGGLAAAIIAGRASDGPKSTGTVAATWILGGTVVGAGVGAIIDLTGSRYEPAPPLPRPSISQRDLAMACAPWVTAQ